MLTLYQHKSHRPLPVPMRCECVDGGGARRTRRRSSDAFADEGIEDGQEACIVAQKPLIRPQRDERGEEPLDECAERRGRDGGLFSFDAVEGGHRVERRAERRREREAACDAGRRAVDRAGGRAAGRAHRAEPEAQQRELDKVAFPSALVTEAVELRQLKEAQRGRSGAVSAAPPEHSEEWRELERRLESIAPHPCPPPCPPTSPPGAVGRQLGLVLQDGASARQ